MGNKGFGNDSKGIQPSSGGKKIPDILWYIFIVVLTAYSGISTILWVMILETNDLNQVIDSMLRFIFY